MYLKDEYPKDTLLFLPLGGAGEIGMNLNLYGYNGKWLMVDLGITFADETLPGVDILVPDPTWIADRRDDLLGLVITHAHEDHLGAVPHLWERLRCPVYATPFAAALLRWKLEEAGLADEVPLHVIEADGKIELGPFAVGMIPVTHSIPESRSLTIETPLGRVVHSGDWKLDPDPLVGPPSDEPAFQAEGDGGVLALVCDSTNVLNPGRSGSEGAVRESLMEIIGARHTGRIAVTTFASNIARVESIAKAAEAHDRHVVLVGRSLWRNTEVARELGYLKDVPQFLSERDAGHLPPDKVLLLCTGCQGEARGAMARIASDDHPHVTLSPGDTVIFSSKVIPGNERTLYALFDSLAKSGMEVITEKDAFVHVSGHPARDELAQMYQWIRPRISVPVHGEARHLIAHADFAKRHGVPRSVIIGNGDVLRLAPGAPEVIDRVRHGRLAVDGGGLVATDSTLLQSRKKLLHNGTVSVTCVVDHKGRLAARPQYALHAVVDLDHEPEMGEKLERAIEEALSQLTYKNAKDDDIVAEAVRQAVRRTVRRHCGRRPVTDIHVVRVTSADAVISSKEKEEAA